MIEGLIDKKLYKDTIKAIVDDKIDKTKNTN